MRFSDGYWMMRPGWSALRPRDIDDVEVGGGRMVVHCPTTKINHRGDTLNRPVLTITFSTPAPAVITVQIEHLAGVVDHGPAFELQHDEVAPVIEVPAVGPVTFSSGDLAVRIDRDAPWTCEFLDPQGNLLTSSCPRSIGYVTDPNGRAYVHEQLFAEGAERGYLLKTTSGDVWQWDQWQAGMGLVDFTNPVARDWYASKLGVLLDQGVDAFKTDFGERIPTEDVQWFDGSDPAKMHNYYAQLYNQCVHDLLVERRGAGEAVLFARSATAGGQQFPVHWGVDCESTFSSMAESLRGGLSLAGGRRGGGRVTRIFTRVKLSLMPYLAELGRIAHHEGLPILRPRAAVR